jgi:MerR HTH family regulatory protein
MYLSHEELAAAVGIRQTTLTRLIRGGFIEPATPGASHFTAASAWRLRRMLRVHIDLGVNLVGAAIVVDLLERLEHLEADLARLRGGP